MFWMNRLARATLTLSLLASVVVGALGAQPVKPVARRAPTTPSVVLPNTTKVKVQRDVPVSARETLTVNIAGGKMPDESLPLWRSNVFVALVSALLGAVVGGVLTGLLGFAAEVAKANLDIGRVHRNALGRMANLSDDYLNDIHSNKGRAELAKAAAEDAACFWGFPRPMDVDPSFTTEVLEAAIVTQVATLNSDIVRYNHRLEDALRSHYDLQGAHLAGTLSPDDWRGAMRNEPEGWDIVVNQLDGLDGLARDVHVRCKLLARQYDEQRSKRPRLFRLGTLRVEPLDETKVAEERQRFDSERRKALAAYEEELARRYGDAFARETTTSLAKASATGASEPETRGG